MFRNVLVCNALLAALAAHAHAQALSAPCSLGPATYVNPVNITTSPTVDLGAQITGAIAQALATGGNTVFVNSGGAPLVPLTTPVVMNNLSNFNVILGPGTKVYGYDLLQPMFTINGGSNVKFSGGSFTGLSPATAPAVCVSVIGSPGNPANTVEVSGVTCSGTTSHGMEVIGYGANALSTQNISIHSNSIHDTGSVNLYASGTTNLCINGNSLVNPSYTGVNGVGDPSNVAVAYSENVYFGQNYVSGTPIWFRQPNPSNTPPSGFYAYSSMNVNTDSNIFANSQCTPDTCSDTGNLPSSPSAVHDDTVLNAININNRVDDFGIGITCELSWSCNAIGSVISNVYDYGLYDESNNSTIPVNSLTSPSSLISGQGVSLQTVNDSISGNPTPVVQASVPGSGVILSQNLGSPVNFGVQPFPSFWIKSSNGQPADGLEFWISADSNIYNAHSKMPLPALPAGQWVKIGLAPPHLTSMGLAGEQTWGLVDPGNQNSDTVRISGYNQLADSRNNVYSGNTISGTGAYPLDVSGCGTNTTFANNTITNTGSVGIWPYYNSGMIGQVFIGGYDNCTRSGVFFNNNTVNLNLPIELGGSALFNLSNYGGNNLINNVVLTQEHAQGPYSGVQNTFVVNNQGSNSTIANPSVNP